MWLKSLIFCVVLQHSFSEESVKPSSKKFIPTNEWQIVEPGQHLPAGLHIRSDIYKGITEAKLLDPDCKDCNENPIQTYKDEDILAKIGEEFAEHDTQIRDEQAPKRAYRSYEEIKAEMKNLNITVDDEPTAINNLIKRFENIASEPDVDDQLTVLLLDLEYYLHQIDNAQYFFKLNGLRRIIFRILKHQNPELQKLALRLLSAAVQHNPKVQLEAVNGDTILILYRLLESEHQSVVLSTLSTISNVIKKFPSAQLAFLRYGAFKTIFGLIERKEYFENPRFKNRVLTLMLDYYEDNQEDISDQVSAEHSKLVLSYFGDHFKDDGWCQVLKKFVDSETDFEIVEKLFPLIYHTKTLCWDTYKQDDFKHSLSEIVKFYDKAALREIEDVLLKHENGVDVDLDNLIYGDLKERLKGLFGLIYGKKVEHSEL